MPYMIQQDGERWCVHKENDDKTAGENVGCSDSEEKAQAHMRALYAADDGEAKATVKAILDGNEWKLDVLGCPYGGPDNGKDAQGEYFSPATKFYEDKFGNPPGVYYHGYGHDRKPASEPVFIGRTTGHWRDGQGMWYKATLDQAVPEARLVWEAAKKGTARASTGAVSHLVRTDADGHIKSWPVAELSLFETESGKRPANTYAVATVAAKALWSSAGLTLPDIDGETGADTGDGESRSAVQVAAKSEARSNDMDANEVQLAIEAALKAERDRVAAEAEQASIKAQLAELAALKAEKVAGNRLDGGMPYVTKYAEGKKFDNLTPGEHAFMVDMLHITYRKGNRLAKQPPSDGALKSLAAKMEAEQSKSEAAHEGMKAFLDDGPGGRSAAKANDMDYSTYANYGDDWVGVQYSSELWPLIRAESWIVNKLPSKEIPKGNESDVLPVEGTDPVWYKVAQATANTSGRPDVTVTASNLGTAKAVATIGKMGCRTEFTGEMTEDSLPEFVPALMRQIQISGSEVMEYVCIDGDTDTTATTNINDIAGTPVGGELFLLTNGFRKLCLITTTSNARSGTTITAEDVLDTAFLMGRNGKDSDPRKVGLICDPWTMKKFNQLPEVKTRDVFSGATLENGMLVGIYGYPIRQSFFICNAGVYTGEISTATYMNLAQTNGKVDLNTESDNTTGNLLAVRWDQWLLRWKRRMTLETQRWAESDVTQIVAMARWGLGYMQAEAAALSYNLTV